MKAERPGTYYKQFTKYFPLFRSKRVGCLPSVMANMNRADREKKPHNPTKTMKRKAKKRPSIKWEKREEK